MKTLSLILLSLILSMSAAMGHEFWISPQSYQLDGGENLVASLRGGQKFEGSPYGYLPPRFVRFQLIKGDQELDVVGRMGDRPALNMAVPQDGLWVVVHETTDSKITWTKWEKFTGFVSHKKLGDTLALHAARGLPQTGFRERFRRFVKSLISVGDGNGADRPVGMRIEFIALKNPYVDDITQGFPVEVLFEGQPHAESQVEIFDRSPAGDVLITTQMTDAKGHALIPVLPGHEYLLDAVKMLPIEPKDLEFDPVWESLWAAMTFAVPGDG